MSQKSDIQRIGVGGIQVLPNRHFHLREEAVKVIAASMAKIGQINAITVYERAPNAGYIVVAGRHRLEAAKSLKWEAIEARVVSGMDALEAEEIEIHENLERFEPTPAEKAICYARLKEIAEDKYRLKAGNPTGANQYDDKRNSPQLEGNSTVDKKANTIKVVSKETGRSAGSIERDAHRVNHIPEIAKVVGTCLDKGVELDALAKLPESRQADLIERALAGQKVKATTEVKKHKRAEKEQELAAKQVALPDAKFGVIYADPEWKFETYSENGMDRSADNHYPTSAVDAICARDVPSIAADDCVLFLWATVPMIQDALSVMSSWGFAYKSQCVWVKDRIGTGYWFRNQHEVLLVGTKGNIPAPAMGDQWASIVEAPVGEHSAKPDAFYSLIEEYFPTLPKIELNARRQRDGWNAWGYEAPIQEIE